MSAGVTPAIAIAFGPAIAAPLTSPHSEPRSMR